jgi:hypothetical protein
MANRRFIDFPIAATVGNNDIVLIWQDGLNKQTTKATLLQGSPQSLAGLTDVDIAALTNGQILQYNSTTSKWENVDRTDIFLSQLGDVTIVAPSNGQVLVYNSSTSKWENSSGGFVPYTGAVTTVNLGSQTIQAGSFVKVGGTAAQFLKANGSVDSTAYGTGSVTSVALTMPTAFTVAGSPITTAGTLAVTGAGLVSQYIRGDGSLADFPATTGGGSSVSYYLNGSVSQGTIGGVAYKELNRTPVFGAGTDISISANGYIASFITDALDPNKLLIPAGNWNFETYFSASSNGGTPSFYVELYKYNGTTFTLIASSSTSPELIAFGTSLNPYFSTLAVPETVLALTDRLALRYYVTHSGRTITLHTENGHLCEVITTFTTGLTALNGLTNQVQFFAVGTSGTDFAISSVTDTHTFNLPTASATNRGALSSADWTTFNGKTSNLGTVTSVGLSSATSGVTIGSTPITTSGTITLAIATASGSQNGLLSSTDWTTFNGKQNALTNPVTGTGTTNNLAKFTGSTTVGNSLLIDNGSKINLTTTAASISSLNIDSTSLDHISLQANRFHLIGGTNFHITNNAYFDSAFKYAQAGIANKITIQSDGSLLYDTSVSGTVGAAVTFINRFNINNLGAAAFSSSVTAGGGLISNGGSIGYGGGELGFALTTAGATSAIYTLATGSPIIYFDHRATSNAGFWVFRNGTGAASERMRITAEGNIGIGTASPAAIISGTETTLNVKGATASSVGSIVARSFGTTNLTTIGLAAFDTINLTALYVESNSPLAIYTNGSEKMRITSGGNVLIGTTTDAGYKLDVNGTGRFSGNVVLGTTALTGGGAAQWLTANGTAYGGGLISSVSGVIKAYYYYDNGANAAMVQAAAGVGVQLWANNTVALSIASTGAATFSSSLGVNGALVSTPYTPNFWVNGTGGEFSVRNNGQEAYFHHTSVGYFGTTQSGSTLYLTSGSGSVSLALTSGGNVLIGTTTDNGAKLNVNGTIRTANPTGSTSDGWLLGRALVSGSSTPDRWIRVQIGNLYYDILSRYIGSV